MEMDLPKIKKWFLTEKRDLPWRINPSPYSVWVSEIMLQQTQASVVIPYFLSWMKKYPNIKSLAEAPIEEVIKMWEGLGYYSRARNLHAGAKYIVDHHKGEFPTSEEEIRKIKGIGPYTLGAILGFAFHQKRAAVDGNVLRVLARYFQIEEDIKKSSTVKKMQTLMHAILPDFEPWIINEALIELGATICQKKPQCSKCPLKSTCKGYINHQAEFLPVKSKGPKTEYLSRFVTVINHDNYYLLRKGQPGEIMQDLYEFPYFDSLPKGTSIKNLILKTHGLQVEKVKDLPNVSHSFTRYQVELTPTLFHSSSKNEIDKFIWVSKPELIKLPFSSGHRKILSLLLQ